MISVTAVFCTAEKPAFRADRSAKTAAWKIFVRIIQKNDTSRKTIPLIEAPAQAAALIESASRILLFLSLDAGGIPALWAISLALSLKSPSLTAEYSGLMKKRTLSKYSHWVCVISTTCLLTPFINLISPFTPMDFYVIFGREKGIYTSVFVRIYIQIV